MTSFEGLLDGHQADYGLKVASKGQDHRILAVHLGLVNLHLSRVFELPSALREP